MANPLGYALVGAGSFGNFCLQQYRTLPAIRCVGVFDFNADATRKTAGDFSIKAYDSMESLLADPEVQLLHLATPPYTHAELAATALRAGKHVLCEKPLALTVDDGRRMIELARERDRVLAVNLIMRYDPLNRIVDEILKQKLLGEVIAGGLLNLARDNQLSPKHWFWDPAKSGGIFVEHAVHFFDLFEMWLGPGQVRTAIQSTRPGNAEIVEQVRCVTEYAGGVLVEQYHGFHQPEQMDRQELRIICERGDLLLRGWLTESIEIDALLTSTQVDRIKELVAGYSTSIASTSSADRTIAARHKMWDADGRYRIGARLPFSKLELYGNVIRDLMADQAAYANDASHPRVITEANGLRSLELAARATELARAAR
ncbi:MAG: Gfo/Idh/MocA family protein [Tepidisphaeraceae bacterium]